jgi:hypothetical protein
MRCAAPPRVAAGPNLRKPAECSSTATGINGDIPDLLQKGTGLT